MNHRKGAVVQITGQQIGRHGGGGVDAERFMLVVWHQPFGHRWMARVGLIPGEEFECFNQVAELVVVKPERAQHTIHFHVFEKRRPCWSVAVAQHFRARL